MIGKPQVEKKCIVFRVANSDDDFYAGVAAFFHIALRR